MVTPATTADWLMATGLFTTLIAFGITGFRWILRDDELVPVATSAPELRPFELERVHGTARVG